MFPSHDTHKEVDEQSTIKRLRKELEGERKANEFLEKDCNRYKELAESRGENNKKFDEENQKLKSEILEYKQINKNLSEELKNSDITNINMQATIIELHEEMDIVKAEKHSYIKNLQISHNIIKQENSQLKAETTNLNELIEKKDIKIEKLEKQLEETENKDFLNTMHKTINLIKSENEAKQIIIEVLIDSLVNERKEKNKYKSQLGL